MREHKMSSKRHQAWCKFGDNCRHFAKGNCKFRHEKGKAIHPEILASAKYKEYLAALEEEKRIDADIKLKEFDVNTQAKEISRIRDLLQKAIDKYKEHEDAFFELGKSKWESTMNINKITKSITRCPKHMKCIEYQTVYESCRDDIYPCKQFHMKKEYDQLLKQWKVMVDTYKEAERKEMETLQAQLDINFYHGKYFELGKRIKSGTTLPDEINAMIRDYCCSVPAKSIKTFDQHSHVMLFCRNHGIYNLAGRTDNCEVCHGTLRGVYNIIQKISKEGLCTCVVLCIDCTSRYGITSEGTASQYIKGDTKNIGREYTNINGDTWLLGTPMMACTDDGTPDTKDAKDLCFKCGCKTHSYYNCDKRSCSRCGSTFHYITQCKLLGCDYCGSASHYSSDCNREKCLRCGSNNHPNRECDEEKCTRCGDHNHYTLHCREQKCQKCDSRDHYTLDCDEICAR